jgi:hypothetical protein
MRIVHICRMVRDPKHVSLVIGSTPISTCPPAIVQSDGAMRGATVTSALAAGCTYSSLIKPRWRVNAAARTGGVPVCAVQDI